MNENNWMLYNKNTGFVVLSEQEEELEALRMDKFEDFYAKIRGFSDEEAEKEYKILREDWPESKENWYKGFCMTWIIGKTPLKLKKYG